MVKNVVGWFASKMTYMRTDHSVCLERGVYEVLRDFNVLLSPTYRPKGFLACVTHARIAVV
jgi:hypothetical protein